MVAKSLLVYLLLGYIYAKAAHVGTGTLTVERDASREIEAQAKVDVGPGLRLGPDLVFRDLGPVSVNSDEVVVYRKIAFEPLMDSVDLLRKTAEIHEESCKNISEISGEVSADFRYFPEAGRYHYDEAKEFCNRNGMQLPEVRSSSDLYNLLEFLTKHAIEAIHSGLRYDKASEWFQYNSDGKPASESDLELMPHCEEITADRWYCYREKHCPPHQHMYRNRDNLNYHWPRNLPTEYKVGEHKSLEICPNVGIGKGPLAVLGTAREIVCQKMADHIQPVDYQNEEEFCYSRQEWMERTVRASRNSVKALTYSVSSKPLPEDPTKIFDLKDQHQKMKDSHISPMSDDIHSSDTGLIIADEPEKETSLSRHRRYASALVAAGTAVASVAQVVAMMGPGTILAAVGSILGLIGLLTAGIGYAVGSALTPTISDLTIDVTRVAEDLDSLRGNVTGFLTAQLEFDTNARREVLATQAFIRQESNLNDDLITFESSLSSLAHGMIDLNTFGHKEMEEVKKIVRETSDKTVSTDASSYKVDPVFLDDRLHIAIRIPLFSKADLARVYAIEKLPTFIENEKYELDCQERHLLIYEESSHWSTLSELEAVQCLDPRERCVVSGAKYHMRQRSCSSAQFFLQEHEAHLVPSKDQLPYVLSHNDTILFAVPDDQETPLEFHCPHLRAAGADQELRVSGSGIIKNPDTCKFDFPELGLSFKPSNVLKAVELKPVSTRFTVVSSPYRAPEKKSYKFQTGKGSLLEVIHRSEEGQRLLSRVTSSIFGKIVVALLVIGGLIVAALGFLLFATRSRLTRYGRRIKDLINQLATQPDIELEKKVREEEKNLMTLTKEQEEELAADQQT